MENTQPNLHARNHLSDGCGPEATQKTVKMSPIIEREQLLAESISYLAVMTDELEAKLGRTLLPEGPEEENKEFCASPVGCAQEEFLQSQELRVRAIADRILNITSRCQL